MSLFLSAILYCALGVSFIAIAIEFEKPKKHELFLMMIFWPVCMMLVALVLSLTKPQ